MRKRVLGLLACTMVLGLGALGAAGCGSDATGDVTPDGSDITTPADGTTPEGDGSDEVVPPSPAAEDCAADPACALPPPAIAEGDCGDGVDGDSDGAVDCADADCTADPLCVLPPPVMTEDCTTPADEDGDGHGQCSDTDCVGDPACSGGGGPWEIDPGILDKFKAIDKNPFPGPGPVCISCPDPLENPIVEREFGF